MYDNPEMYIMGGYPLVYRKIVIIFHSINKLLRINEAQTGKSLGKYLISEFLREPIKLITSQPDLINVLSLVILSDDF